LQRHWVGAAFDHLPRINEGNRIPHIAFPSLDYRFRGPRLMRLAAE
jgi:hypothetical protein